MEDRCLCEREREAERKVRLVLAASRVIFWIIWIAVESHHTS
ncbi:hypothetical protein [Sphaerimonospora cavernae]